MYNHESFEVPKQDKLAPAELESSEKESETIQRNTDWDEGIEPDWFYFTD